MRTHGDGSLWTPSVLSSSYPGFGVAVCVDHLKGPAASHNETERKNPL